MHRHPHMSRDCKSSHLLLSTYTIRCARTCYKTLRFANSSTNSETLCTIHPTCRFGGSSTFTTFTCGVKCTPTSLSATDLIGFFFAAITALKDAYLHVPRCLRRAREIHMDHKPKLLKSGRHAWAYSAVDLSLQRQVAVQQCVAGLHPPLVLPSAAHLPHPHRRQKLPAAIQATRHTSAPECRAASADYSCRKPPDDAPHTHRKGTHRLVVVTINRLLPQHQHANIFLLYKLTEYLGH